EFLFYPPCLEAAKRPNDFLSAFRLKRTKRHRTSIKRPPTKRKIGLSRRWAKLVAICLSKRTDNPASYGFGDISLQEVMAARLSGLGFRRGLGAGSVFMHDRGIVYQNLVPG